MNGAVLAVDDDVHILEFLVTLLTMSGFTVRSAMNGREALSVLSTWKPDVIILDLRMPHMDGMTFLEKRQDHPVLKQIPVLAITGDWSLAFETSPADVVLPKPFSIGQLLDHVRGLIAAVSA